MLPAHSRHCFASSANARSTCTATSAGELAVTPEFVSTISRALPSSWPATTWLMIIGQPAAIASCTVAPPALPMSKWLSCIMRGSWSVQPRIFAGRPSTAVSIAGRSLSARPIVTVRSTPRSTSRRTRSGAPRVAAWIMYKTRRSEFLEGKPRFPATSANFGLTGNPNTLILPGTTPTAFNTDALCSLATRK